MRADADPAKMRERDDQPNGAVPAHAEQAHVVEKDHAGRARRVHRFDKQRTHEHIAPARLIDHGAAEAVVLLMKDPRFLRDAPAAQIRPARDDNPRRLAAGVGVDGNDALEGRIRVHQAHSRETP